MITVADAVSAIVRQSPLLEEGLARGLMNTSAVARDMRGQVEAHTRKEVTDGAVIMALQRLSASLASTGRSQAVFQNAPDMVIRSNLYECTVSNSPALLDKQRILLDLVRSHDNRDFLTITSGVFETTVVASIDLRGAIQDALCGEDIRSEILGLASITIRLTDDIVAATGSYAQILRLIAWEGINVVEVVSTHLELTIILEQSEVGRAFTALKNAFHVPV